MKPGRTAYLRAKRRAVNRAAHTALGAYAALEGLLETNRYLRALVESGADTPHLRRTIINSRGGAHEAEINALYKRARAQAEAEFNKQYRAQNGGRSP
jgi:hypothetical protein